MKDTASGQLAGERRRQSSELDTSHDLEPQKNISMIISLILSNTVPIPTAQQSTPIQRVVNQTRL